MKFLDLLLSCALFGGLAVAALPEAEDFCNVTVLSLRPEGEDHLKPRTKCDKIIGLLKNSSRDVYWKLACQPKITSYVETKRLQARENFLRLVNKVSPKMRRKGVKPKVYLNLVKSLLDAWACYVDTFEVSLDLALEARESFVRRFHQVYSLCQELFTLQNNAINDFDNAQLKDHFADWTRIKSRIANWLQSIRVEYLKPLLPVADISTALRNPHYFTAEKLAAVHTALVFCDEFYTMLYYTDIVEEFNLESASTRGLAAGHGRKPALIEVRDALVKFISALSNLFDVEYMRYTIAEAEHRLDMANPAPSLQEAVAATRDRYEPIFHFASPEAPVWVTPLANPLPGVIRRSRAPLAATFKSFPVLPLA